MLFCNLTSFLCESKIVNIIVGNINITFFIILLASTVPESSDEELILEQKVKMPTPESPRKSRMGPKKTALAQVSASQDDEEIFNDPVPSITGKGETTIIH